jgi:hypothetical protein
MAYTDPVITVAADDVHDAADWNTYVRDNESFLFKPPRVRVTDGNNQPASDSSQTPITFDTEQFDTDTMHDLGTNPERITFTTAGVYLVGGNIGWASSSAGRRQLRILLNGTTQLNNVVVDVDSVTGHRMNVVTIFDMAANDYVELQAFQTSGGDLNVTAAQFWAVWQGAAT